MKNLYVAVTDKEFLIEDITYILKKPNFCGDTPFGLEQAANLKDTLRDNVFLF